MLGTLPVLGISFTTLLATPILARGIHHLRHSLEGVRTSLPAQFDPIQNVFATFDSSLQLPVVLKILCYSAVFAAIGKCIYLLRCPLYFKKGLSFDDFVRSVPSAHESLATEFLGLWNDSNSTEEVRGIYMDEIHSISGLRLTLNSGEDLKKAHLNHETILLISGTLYNNPRESMSSNLRALIRTPSFGQGIIGVLQMYRDRYRPWSRRWCAWVYYMALGLFLWALSLQLKWVLLELSPN